jgi:predicted nucleic acid-binding protein
MCLIVDNNVAADFFCGSNPDLDPLKKAVFNATCCLYYGGTKLRNEYFRSPKVRRVVKNLDQAGRAKAISDVLVDARMNQVEPNCISDDPHIIALALESGARLLCSFDQALHTDFTNAALINNPRGSVYQQAGHQHLIRKHCKSC